jgi:hypothetical protein
MSFDTFSAIKYIYIDVTNTISFADNIGLELYHLSYLYMTDF